MEIHVQFVIYFESQVKWRQDFFLKKCFPHFLKKHSGSSKELFYDSGGNNLEYSKILTRISKNPAN